MANNRVTMDSDERDLLFLRTEGPGEAQPVVTQYNYDASRNLAAVITNPGASQKKADYIYDGFNRLHSVRDAMGNSSNFFYDKKDRLLTSEIIGEVVDTAATIDPGRQRPPEPIRR